MRKDYWIVLFLVLFVLFGCGSASSSNTDTDVNCYLFEGGMNLEAEAGEYSGVIRSYTECQDLLYRVMTDSHQPYLIAAKLASYDKSFFRENMLVFTNFPEGTTGYRVELENVEYVDSVVKLQLRKWGEVGSEKETKYGVIVELPRQEKIETVEYTMIEESPESTRGEKNDTVKILGAGEFLHLSYAEIAEKLNVAGEKGVSLKLELNVSSYWEAYTPSEMTKNEALALANQYRSRVEAHYSAANQEVMDGLDMTGFGSAFRIDHYGPWAYANFPSGITEKDVEWIHNVMLCGDRIVAWSAILSPTK